MEKTVVEQIKDRLPITEVLASYITVEQSGSQYKAKCPFHNERTASFYISPDRGLYYCFGCGAKGDIFSFVSNFEGLDFKGALKVLADRAGVSLASYKGERVDTDPLYEALEKATIRYQEVLSKTPDALSYLSDRGISKETIEAFRIGYAPDEWRFIESSYDEEGKKIAIRAGLLKNQEGKIYDRFRKRIMFPIHDSSGRVVGFSGRIFPQGDTNEAKYLNSPEGELFQKSKVLFGFDKAKTHIKKHNFAILVEGQMDLVMSHQAGFKNTVATSGTALSLDAAEDYSSHLSVLSRLTPHLFLAFDGDEAGQKAMDRVALVALSLGMNPKVVVVPGGSDPAEYIQEYGKDAWKDRLKESKHFIQHHLDLIRSKGLSPHMFASAIRKTVFPFLSKVFSPIERATYVELIARETGIPVGDIVAELSTVVLQDRDIQKSSGSDSLQEKNTITPYERLVALRKIFPSEGIERACDPLQSLSVSDMIFSAPSIPEEKVTKAIYIAEKEYTPLSEEERVELAGELVARVVDEFLLQARQHFSALLQGAKENAEEEHRILKILEEVNKRRLSA